MLLVFQAMDAAGKDSTIKHVMSGVNPQGVDVTSFKAPSSEELDHDFLWRCMQGAARARPHRHLQPLATTRKCWSCACTRRSSRSRSSRPSFVTKEHLEGALRGHRELRALPRPQRHLVLKFFLHVSKDEQKKRFLERLDEPEKNWKFSGADVKERAHWNEYMHAYEDAIRAHGGAARALVRRARRQQVVHAARRRGGDRPGDRAARPALPESRRRRQEGVRRVPQVAACGEGLKCSLDKLASVRGIALLAHERVVRR